MYKVPRVIHIYTFFANTYKLIKYYSTYSYVYLYH